MPWGPNQDLFYGQTVLASPNDPLVGPDDFAESFGLGDGSFASLSTLDQARAQTAVEIASAAVRTKTGQILTQVTETVTLDASGNDTLVLPQYPVTAITSVTRDGVTLDPATYQWASPVGSLRVIDGTRWLYPQVITVTYTHGWDPLPRDIAGVVLGRAKRWYDNPSGQSVQSETLGAWSVTYADAASGEFTDEELDILGRYSQWTFVS